MILICLKRRLRTILGMWIAAVTQSWLISCGAVRVTSQPEGATVSLVSSAGQTVKLGETPWSSSNSDFEKVSLGLPVTLIVEKAGFVPASFGIPETANSDFQFEATLAPVQECRPHDINDIVTLVLRAEKAIAEEKFDDGLQMVSKIKEMDGGIGAAYQLEGTIYLLTKKFDLSRRAWLEAARINPKNKEVQRMLQLLEAKVKDGGK